LRSIVSEMITFLLISVEKILYILHSFTHKEAYNKRNPKLTIHTLAIQVKSVVWDQKKHGNIHEHPSNRYQKTEKKRGLSNNSILSVEIKSYQQ